MKNRLFVAALFGFALPYGASAQSAPPAAEAGQDPYVQLLESFLPPGGLEAAQKNHIRDIRAFYEKDADFAEFDQSCPGAIDRVMMTIQPILVEYDVIELRLRKEAMAEILKGAMSPQQARDAATFYSGPLGRKLMSSMMANHSLSNTLEALSKSEDENPVVDADAIAKDNLQTANKAVDELTSEELEILATKVGNQEWFEKLMLAKPKMFEAGLAIGNSDFAPHLDERMEREVDAAVESHLETCDY